MPLTIPACVTNGADGEDVRDEVCGLCDPAHGAEEEVVGEGRKRAVEVSIWRAAFLC